MPAFIYLQIFAYVAYQAWIDALFGKRRPGNDDDCDAAKPRSFADELEARGYASGTSRLPA